MPFNYTKSKVYPYLDQIKEWSDQGLGSRVIAERLGFNRSAILMAYRKIGLDTKNKTNPIKPIPEKKECIDCKQVKRIEEFRKRQSGRYESVCKICEKERGLKSCRYRYNNNTEFKIRCVVSNGINSALNKRNLTNTQKFYINNLPYTIEELKQHIESQFEPWMNWSNWGKYEVEKWNDNDISTWKWNLDHIIPKSKFKYTSIEDEDFKKCWALSNLRPLSAKENLIEGNRR